MPTTKTMNLILNRYFKFQTSNGNSLTTRRISSHGRVRTYVKFSHVYKKSPPACVKSVSLCEFKHFSHYHTHTLAIPPCTYTDYMQIFGLFLYSTMSQSTPANDTSNSFHWDWCSHQFVRNCESNQLSYRQHSYSNYIEMTFICNKYCELIIMIHIYTPTNLQY